jgi:hypothetical protein
VAQQSEKPSGVWDITGIWRLTSEEIEDKKDEYHVNQWILRIYRSDKVKSSQLFGRFKLSEHMEGYVGFVKPAQSKSSQPHEHAKAGQKRKRANSDKNLTGRRLSSSSAKTTRDGTNNLLRALAKSGWLDKTIAQLKRLKLRQTLLAEHPRTTTQPATAMTMTMKLSLKKSFSCFEPIKSRPSMLHGTIVGEDV